MKEYSKGQRIYSLDVLRIVATIFIIFHHYQQCLGLYFDEGINYFGGKFSFGYIVEVFFVLSGYLSAKRILVDAKDSFLNYFKKHYLRLIPLVIMSVIVFEALMILYYASSGDTYYGKSINIFGSMITALGVQEGWMFHNPGINNPVWYVSVLLLCYIVLYCIVYLCKKLKIAPVCGFITMVILGLVIKKYKLDFPFFNLASARGYYSFFTGATLSYYIDKFGIDKKEIAISIFIVFAIIFSIVNNNVFIMSKIGPVMAILFAPSLIIIITREPIIKLCNYKIIGEIGKITYDVYIWHVCVQILIRLFVKLSGLDSNILMNKGAMYIYCFICFLVGIASHYLIEEPINRKIFHNI